MRTWKEQFYSSRSWQACRETVIRRDQYLCQDCLRQGWYTPAEEVHHIVPLTSSNYTDGSVALNPRNLVSLCRKCHAARHAGYERRYRVDDLGRVILSPEVPPS